MTFYMDDNLMVGNITAIDDAIAVLKTFVLKIVEGL